MTGFTFDIMDGQEDGPSYRYCPECTKGALAERVQELSVKQITESCAKIKAKYPSHKFLNRAMGSRRGEILGLVTEEINRIMNKDVETAENDETVDVGGDAGGGGETTPSIANRLRAGADRFARVFQGFGGGAGSSSSHAQQATHTTSYCYSPSYCYFTAHALPYCPAGR